MNKTTLKVVSAVFILAVILIVVAFLLESSAKKSIKNNENLCLISSQICEIDDVKIYSKSPMSSMKELSLMIENLDSSIDLIEARIYGLNMDMGEINVVFKRIDDSNNFETKVFLSACVYGEMLYKLEFSEPFSKYSVGFLID